jgi:hypothetical protein
VKEFVLGSKAEIRTEVTGETTSVPA